MLVLGPFINDTKFRNKSFKGIAAKIANDILKGFVS
jgi:hypothetical protein